MWQRMLSLSEVQQVSITLGKSLQNVGLSVFFLLFKPQLSYCDTALAITIFCEEFTA